MGLILSDRRYFSEPCPVCGKPIEAGQTICGAVRKEDGKLVAAHIGCGGEFVKMVGGEDDVRK